MSKASIKTKSNRIIAIDILRGLTLLGVVIVNAATINGPYFMDTVDFAFKFHWLDHFTSEILSIFFLEKFYPIFVFLFGLSNQLYISSLLKKYQGQFNNNNYILKIFSKRMFVLAIIGLFHISLFFWGDVLLVYSILGIALILILNNIVKYDIKKLMQLNLVLIITTIALSFIVHNLVLHDKLHDNFDEHFKELVIDSDDTIPEATNIYHKGSVFRIIQHNLESHYNIYFFGPFDKMDLMIFLDNINYLIELLILMLFGAAVSMVPDWYKKILSINKKKLYSLLLVSFSLLIGTEYVQYKEMFNLDHYNVLLMLNNISSYLLLYLVAYQYLSNLNSPMINRIFDKLAATGRMTLTWYLMLSALMSFVLYKYGLALYGQIGVTACAMIAVYYYCFCYQISLFWLSKHKQGPIEGIWRRLSSYTPVKDLAKVPQ